MQREWWAPLFAHLVVAAVAHEEGVCVCVVDAWCVLLVGNLSLAYDVSDCWPYVVVADVLFLVRRVRIEY